MKEHPIERNTRNPQLSDLKIGDEASQRSLLEQAVSAVDGYAKKTRTVNSYICPFVVFTNPDSTNPDGTDWFLVGDVKGILSGKSFTLDSVFIHHVCPTVEQLQEVLGTAAHLNPSTPQLVSG
ncbi:hypothetical protein HGA88_06745 [Candidatus Roizmanbacteria bacterium]|nr:hypothetical protein [Candidatus Roizmanbacteria bacterium]